MFNYYSSERIHACSHRLNSCQKQLKTNLILIWHIICGIAVCSTPVILQHKVTQHIFVNVLFLLCYFKLHLPCCQLSRIIWETPDEILDRISWSPDYEISQLFCVVQAIFMLTSNVSS